VNLGVKQREELPISSRDGAGIEQEEKGRRKGGERGESG